MNDDVILFVVFVVMLCVACLVWIASAASIAQDCRTLGAFRIDQTVYECKLKETK